MFRTKWNISFFFLMGQLVLKMHHLRIFVFKNGKLFTILDIELSVTFSTKGMTNTRKPLQFGFRISELVFQ